MPLNSPDPPRQFENPTGHLRYVQRDSPMEGPQNVLQQEWVVHTNEGVTHVWRDVPIVPVGQE
jgi:hypothetical protein